MKKDILLQLVRESARAVKESKKQKSPSELIAAVKPAERNFKSAIETGKKQIALIAEIKKASPSAFLETRFLAKPKMGAFCPWQNRGAGEKMASPSSSILRKDFGVADIAAIYNNHAQAISIITSASFLGKKEFIVQAKQFSSLPILRKDFVIDEYQLYESLAIGADAALLIAAILSKKKLENFVKLSKEIGLQCLVEVHNRKELESLPEEAEIIGINNRDLKTMKIDLNNFKKLSKLIPQEKLLVAESGYDSKQQIDSLKGKADAVLIGSALMRSVDIEKKLAELGF